jgi:hypothetical protein
MHNTPGCSVGLLRPAEIAPFAIFHDHVLPKRSREAAFDAANTDDQVDSMVDMFHEAAKKLGIPLAFTQYQLVENPKGHRVIDRKRQRRVQQNDVLTTINPTCGRLQFTAGLMTNHPLQRGLVAFTDHDEFMDTAPIVGLHKVPLALEVRDGERDAINRLFMMHIPPNEEESANAYGNNLKIVEHVLRYPDVPHVRTRNFDGPFSTFDHGERLASPECRSILVEESTDAHVNN